METKKENSSAFYLLTHLLFLVMLAAGVTCLIFHGRQQPIQAEITHVGQISSQYHPRRRGSSAYTSYHADITVRYEADGEQKTVELKGTWKNNWIKPRAGQRTNITIGILGRPVFWPDDTLQTIGWVLTAMSGFFWGMKLYLRSSCRPRSPFEEQNNPLEQDPPRFASPDFVRQEDGSWKWSGRTDEAYERYTFRGGLTVCGIISAGLIILCAVINPETIWIGLLTAGIIMGISLVSAFFGIRSTQVNTLPYHLTRDYLQIGSGRGSRMFEYSRLRSIETEGLHLILHTRFGRGYVYAPPEDLDQLRGWLERRISRPYTI